MRVGGGRILATGLNPAWQRTVVFESFEPGAVNRAKSVREGAAGKGANFARAAKIWGKAEALTVQFAGGRTGSLLMEAMAREGLAELTRRVEAPTRVCTTILSGKAPAMTELIEPSGEVSQEDSRALLEAALSALPKSGALALCGSFPPGTGEAFYEKLALAAAKEGKPVLMDSFMAVERTLASGAVDLLKINVEEFRKLSGEDESGEALRSALKRFKLQAIALTDGPRPARLADGKGLWSYELPELSGVVNPLGAGDCCSAVALSDILSGAPAAEAFGNGLAAASASCLTDACSVFSPAKAAEIRAATHVNFQPWV